MRVDVSEPRPLMTLPRVAVLAVVVAAVLVLVGGGAVGVRAESTLRACQLRDMKHETAIDFTFLPLGYDCVYYDDFGQEVGRTRAPGW